MSHDGRLVEVASDSFVVLQIKKSGLADWPVWRIATDRKGCAPCKGRVFQWVKVPTGNFCSSRKQSKQSWR